MLSLIRIRIKYIIRHPCLLFWSYLFLPIVILIIALVSLSDKKDLDLISYKSVSLKTPLDFFKEGEQYSKLSPYLPYTGILIDDKNKCDKIDDILDDYHISFSNCSNKESDFDDLIVNIVQIEQKDGKYKVELTSRNTNYIRGINPNSNQLFKRDELDQDAITDPFYVINNNKTLDYNFQAVFELQSMISVILIKLEGKSISHNFRMDFGYNKYPDSYHFTNVDKIIFPGAALSFLVTLQFSLIVYNINMRMIDEKENKLNILLERQGISYFKYILSWLFTSFAIFTISIVAYIIVMLAYSNGHIYLFIVNLILFSLSIFSVCVLFTTCISTSKTGATAIKFYNFGSIFLGFAIIMPKSIKITKIIFAFIPQINFFMNFWITYCLGNFDKLTGDLFLLRASKISYAESIIMYISSIIFYLLISIIVRSYQNSGLTFCLFLKSCFVKVSRDVGNNLVNEEKIEFEKFEEHFQELSQINKQKLDQNQCLKLINVSKSFEDVKAVKCFNGELFSNEIFCLLGHNGAGKTTLINMISGIFDPDQGDILLNGRSIVTDKKYLYESIGLCQQEDIFFDYLTVEEHLEYMCKIKGSRVNHQEIDELITKIDLLPKKKSLCSTLSGGQKRKLCIALALIGDSKIILLDEPTSGMDIMARRSLWEFLKNYKKDKIILLTTHFLDEAEYLGDRIGIMSEGEYICCGTSSYLKSKYPCGFNINLLIDPKVFNEGYKIQFYNQILKYEPRAEIKVASKGIFSINIQSNNQNINDIFNYIENSKNAFGIQDYTVGSTSLEDVFLKLNDKGNLGNQKYSNMNAPTNFPLMPMVPRVSDFCTQLNAHIIRNLYPLYRNKTLFFFELLSGLGIVYIFIFFFSDLIITAMTKTLDLVEVLNQNKIYIYTKNLSKDFFINSDVYKRFGTYIDLYEIKENTDNINDFMDLAYKNALANIAKGAIWVEKSKRDENDFYYVYNTEINNNRYGYFYANSMLFISSFLKESYQIDVTILNKIIHKSASGNSDKLSTIFMDSLVLIIVCLINLFGYIIFLGGLMHEKIKEKRTNIKHLLYLSGNNLLSYWLGFYITDYIKLFIFTILLILPLYTVNGSATYFGLNLLIINISSLSFIYFITFFCSKDGDGAKVLFTFIFSFYIIIVAIAIAIGSSDADIDLINFFQLYVPNIFDVTPITSMAYSSIRIIISYVVISALKEENFDVDIIKSQTKFGFPEEYLMTSYIAQLINIVFYSLLLLLAESGLLGDFIHYMHQICYANKEVNNKNQPIMPIMPISPVEINNINQNDNNYNEYNSINYVSDSYDSKKENPLIDKPSINNYENNTNIINTSSNMNTIQNNNNQIIYNQYNNNPYMNNQYNNQYMTNQNTINQYGAIQNPQNAYINPNYNQNNLDFNFKGENLTGDPLQNPYVQHEINKVNSSQELTTRIIDLTKTFYPCCFCCCKEGKVRAINHLHLGLEPNEKFGLLGFNGSGKTTTFKAITNEIRFDSGSINLFGNDSRRNFQTIRTMIGYCPQINPLFDFMKVREILQFYSKLKISNETPESVCQKFGLSKYLDTYTVNLSGGNKRKLTFAIAMMNKPTLLLLDEPSTGVDPESRRIMWRNINELSNSGHRYNMILTTHSMEEAEILCDTVSWLRAGNFITLGNPEELKLKYSAGYKLHIKFNEIVINSQNYSQAGNLQQSLNILISMIERFNIYSNIILSNPTFGPYLISLINVVSKIKDKIKKISLYSIGRDYSFELVLQIVNERKKDLFSQILNMKNEDKSIDELSISMQSLENILTSI